MLVYTGLGKIRAIFKDSARRTPRYVAELCQYLLAGAYAADGYGFAVELDGAVAEPFSEGG